jgi:DNA-binding PadR family transcriptional regulator
LAPLVGVMDDPQRMSLPDGHVQGIKNQLGAKMRGHRPSKGLHADVCFEIGLEGFALGRIVCYTHSASSGMASRHPHASDLQPEYVVLGLLIQQPSHGYELHRRLRAEFRMLWRIPQNQLYSLLKRLEARGDIIGEAARSAGGPPRWRYTVTRRGRSRFRRWLKRPTPPSARALRVAFLTRLGFALSESREAAAILLEAQRRTLLGDVARLRQMAQELSAASFQDRLSLELRMRQLDTTLAWMDAVRLELGL